MEGSTCDSSVFKDIRERNSFLAVRSANTLGSTKSIAKQVFRHEFCVHTCVCVCVCVCVCTYLCVCVCFSYWLSTNTYFVTAVNRQICSICHYHYCTTRTLRKPHDPIDPSQGLAKPPVPSSSSKRSGGCVQQCEI
jgi:hypothetical protein